MGCHNTVAPVVLGTGRKAQLICFAPLHPGAQASGHEERKHSDQETQTQDAQE